MAGLVLGYVMWVVAVSIGMATTTVSRWSVIVLIGSVVLAAVAVLWVWWLRHRRNYPLAAFVFAIPTLPVVLALMVLAETYL